MNRLACFILVLLLAWAPLPTFAESGSYLETIYAADDGTGDSSGLAPEPAAPEAAPAPEPAAAPQEVAPAPAGVQFQAVDIQEYIRKIIEALLSKYGAGLAGKTIIIRLPSGCCPKVPPSGGCGQPQPTTPTQPTQPTQPAQPTTPSDPSSIAGLKAEMRSKYGISANAGNGADWSQRQLEEANKVLATLPERFRNCTKNINRDTGSDMPRGVLGWVQMGIPTVHMLNLSCREGTFQGTMVHEMAHCFQANNMAVTRAFEQQFWPNGRGGGARPASVSGYGNTQPIEDMAESVRAYWQAGAQMKASNPARYEFVKKNVFDGKEF